MKKCESGLVLSERVAASRVDFANSKNNGFFGGVASESFRGSPFPENERKPRWVNNYFIYTVVVVGVKWFGFDPW